MRAAPAATSNGTVKVPEPETSIPVSSGAKDAPKLPPKFCSDTSDETICEGAASIGMEFTEAVEKLKLATASVRKVTANVVPGVYAPAIVNNVARKSPPTANTLRTSVTRHFAAISRSAAQPPKTVQAVPTRNGSIPTKPVVNTDRLRWRTR